MVTSSLKCVRLSVRNEATFQIFVRIFVLCWSNASTEDYYSFKSLREILCVYILYFIESVSFSYSSVNFMQSYEEPLSSPVLYRQRSWLQCWVHLPTYIFPSQHHMRLALIWFIFSSYPTGSDPDFWASCPPSYLYFPGKHHMRLALIWFIFSCP